jgi:hypothetical protein
VHRALQLKSAVIAALELHAHGVIYLFLKLQPALDQKQPQITEMSSPEPNFSVFFFGNFVVPDTQTQLTCTAP